MVSRGAWTKVNQAVRRHLFGPRFELVEAKPVTELGTDYGGWSLLGRDSLHDSWVVSCGAGEDVSFDVELMRLYGAHVVFVDPTPRALAHVEALCKRVGARSTRPFASGGKQPIDAYDLSGVMRDQIDMLALAVSGTSGFAKFFEPPTSEGVSYSLTNFQNSYSRTTPSIEVETIALPELLEQVGHEISVLKMDIEGAEIEALEALESSRHRPQQILVEFDELAQPSVYARNRFELGHSALLRMGYQAFYFDGRTCASYARGDQLMDADW